MVTSRGVEAYLVHYHDDTRYPEHDRPASSQDATRTSAEVYVEAVAGERYAIVVVLRPDFDFQQSPRVRIRWELDGSQHHVHFTASKIQAAFRSKGCFEHRIASTPVRMEGKWKICGLTFNSGLYIDEISEPSPDQLLHDSDHVARIKVEVHCGIENGRGSGEPILPAEPTAQSQEVAMNARATLATRYTAIEHYEPPKRPRRFVPSKDPRHRPVVINLRFGSRTSLQLLKIIRDDSIHQSPISSRTALEACDNTKSASDVPITNKKHKATEACAGELPHERSPGRTSPGRINTHEEQSTAPIKKEQRDETELDTGGDIAIVEVRKASPSTLAHVTQSPPSNGATNSHSGRKRALAEIRLEELGLEERALNVKRQQLELKRQMLEMD